MSTYIGINKFKSLIVLLIVGPFLSACTMTARVTDLISAKPTALLPAPAIDNTIATGSKPNISFQDTNVTVGEGSSITISINLSAPLSSDTQINLTIGSAAGGDRFNPLPTTFTIPAGVTNVNLMVNTIDDTLIQNSEQWNITITPVSSDLNVTNGTLVATVNDNDGGNIADPPPATPIPKMLKDLNVYPESLTSINAIGKMFYIGADLAHGEELWVSDGTIIGTKLVKDINVGQGSSKILNFFKNETNTLVFFTAYTPTEGYELWRSDGTDVGTFLVKDLEPGAVGSSASAFFADGNTVFFTGMNTIDGNEIFVTDGSLGNATVLGDLDGGWSWSSILAGEAKKHAGFTYIGYEVNNDGCIVKTDGTPAGTTNLGCGTVAHGNFLSAPTDLTFLGNFLIFSAGDWDLYYEPFALNLTTNEILNLKDIVTGWSGSFPDFYDFPISGKIPFVVQSDSDGTKGIYFTNGTPAGTAKVAASVSPLSIFGQAGSQLIFTSALTSTDGSELWITDGTGAGTTLLKDIYTGSGSSTPNSSSPLLMGQIGSNFIFSATDGTNGTEVWVTDGTPVGTVLLKDINPGSASSNPTSAIKIGSSKIAFIAETATEGKELWITDGSAAGTIMVKDVVPGSKSSGIVGLNNFNNLGVFFAAYNSASKYGSTFASDLTSAGTIGFGHAMVTSRSSNASSFLQFNSLVYFNAIDGAFGNQLWSTDGTSINTLKIKDVNPNVNCTDIGGMFSFNGSLFFVATDKDAGKEYFISDGSAAGTSVLKDINPGSASSQSFFTNPFVNNGTNFFFSATDDTNGIELWKSDGTLAGTQLVKDLYTGTTTTSGVTTGNSGSPSSLTRIAGSNDIIFTARTSSASNVTVFTTDGTAANTLSVAGLGSNISVSFYPVSLTLTYVYAYENSTYKYKVYSYNHSNRTATHLTPSYATDLVSNPFFNSRLGKFFWMTNVASGNSPKAMVSDGTVGGTTAFMTASGSSKAFQSYYEAGTEFYFLFNNVGTVEIWKTDGTVGGTSLVKSGLTGYPSFRESIGSLTYMSLSDGPNGNELWVTDGTSAGTQLLKDIAPGTGSGITIYSDFLKMGTNLYFTADDGVNGMELWKSDGTAAGTVLLSDINPGPDSSSPNLIKAINGTLYFNATKTLSGTETWVYTP